MYNEHQNLVSFHTSPNRHLFCEHSRQHSSFHQGRSGIHEGCAQTIRIRGMFYNLIALSIIYTIEIEDVLHSTVQPIMKRHHIRTANGKNKLEF